LPLYVPEAYIGFRTINCRKALDDGLTFRPLAETIHDTLVWKGNDAIGAWQGKGGATKVGLKPAQEQEVLQKWKQEGI